MIGVGVGPPDSRPIVIEGTSRVKPARDRRPLTTSAS